MAFDLTAVSRVHGFDWITLLPLLSYKTGMSGINTSVWAVTVAGIRNFWDICFYHFDHHDTSEARYNKNHKFVHNFDFVWNILHFLYLPQGRPKYICHVGRQCSTIFDGTGLINASWSSCSLYLPHFLTPHTCLSIRSKDCSASNKMSEFSFVLRLTIIYSLHLLITR